MEDKNKIQDRELEELKQRLRDREEELNEDITEIRAILKPLTETYQTATKMGKWVFALMVFLSILFGIILSFKSIFAK